MDPSDVIAAHDQLGEIRDLLRTGTFPLGRGLGLVSRNPVVWSGGGVAVAATPTALDLAAPGLEGASILIVTPHADPLAWLLQRLQSVFARLDPPNLMRRLGEAAYWFQEDYPDDTSAEGILGAVLDEASAVLRELANASVFTERDDP